MTDPVGEPSGGQLWVRRDVGGDGVVVRVAGEVDLVTADRLADELAAVRGSRLRELLVVDLSEVTFLTSAGLKVLVEHTQLCRESGVELCVVPGNRTIARTIMLTGLADVLTVRDSLDAALEAAYR